MSYNGFRGRVAELADALDSKSSEVHSSYRFDPDLGHHNLVNPLLRLSGAFVSKTSPLTDKALGVCDIVFPTWLTR